jgi:GNAT superfamily N-acetyltransferase
MDPIRRIVEPAEAEIDELRARLGAGNLAAVGQEPQHVLFSVRGAGSRLAAGLFGRIWFGLFHVRLLWVDPARRGEGLGTALMRAAEAEAGAQGCRAVYLDTATFQAGPFYARLGYREIARVQGYGHGVLFFAKDL